MTEDYPDKPIPLDVQEAIDRQEAAIAATDPEELRAANQDLFTSLGIDPTAEEPELPPTGEAQLYQALVKQTRALEKPQGTERDRLLQEANEEVLAALRDRLPQPPE